MPSPLPNPSETLARFQAVQREIQAAVSAARREAGAVTLVAVSKTFGTAAIEPLLRAGHRVFGENRVQEAMAKWPGLKADHLGTELHLIGPLQTNKAREAVRLFDVIETLDRPKLARALKDAGAKEGRMPRLLVEINTGAESQKAGILPAEADAFIELARDELGLPVKGLMCIPPHGEEPDRHFAVLAKIAARNSLKTLSMGMSADFKIAIALGATHVRLGTAIFGQRSAGH